MPLRISHLAAHHIHHDVPIFSAPAFFACCLHSFLVGEAMKVGVASLYRVTAMTKSMDRTFYNTSVTFINARR